MSKEWIYEKGLYTHGIYKHFKGNKYMVLTLAQHTETNEKMVVYQALYGYGRVYVRPYDMFISKVDKNKYPDVEQKYRFEFIATQDDYEKM